MFLHDYWQKLVKFFSFWYLRYLLVTELYIVEPWERAIMHIIMAIFFLILSYLNVLLARCLPVILSFISEAASSLLLVTVGLIIRGQYQKYREFLDEHFFSLPFMLVCVGIILLVITFFGCCGALQENYCMIWMFSILLGLLFIMETTLGFTAYALSDKAHNILSVSLNDTMQLYNKSFEITKVWDSLQINLHCCGINTHSDWYPVLNNSLPMSCCEPQTGAVGQELCNETVSTLHRSSCLDSLSSIIIENATTLGAVGIGIALGQVLGVFFSCVLARRIRNNYENFE